MNSQLAAYRHYRNNIAAFSRDVIGYPLYNYQAGWAQTVLDAVASRRNQTIVVKMPRQSGKNEASAQLEVALLARFGKAGGEIVKVAPTFKPQIVNSKLRLELRSRQAMDRLPELAFRSTMGYMVRCRNAGISFLSADPKASVVGATASLLLEVDEAQDVLPSVYNKNFAPMRSSTAAPVVAYGTTWTDDTLLEQFANDVLEGRTPGHVITVTVDAVAAENPAYGEYVAGEAARLGREHPLIRTQYYMETLVNRGRFLSTTHLKAMIGEHKPETTRTGHTQIVAGLDFAGADEGAGELISASSGSQRDSVALTVGAVQWNKVIAGVVEPTVRTLARYEWINVHPLSLNTVLYQLLANTWKVTRVHCDATGIGATGTAMLAKQIDPANTGRVTARTFDSAWNTQTELASLYYAAISAGRFLDYKPADFDPLAIAGQPAPDRNDPDRHAWWQRGHARLEARPNKRFHVYVPETEGHDDLVISEMLMIEAAHNLMPAAEIKQTQRARTQ